MPHGASTTAAEIASQPGVWRRAAGLAGAAGDVLPRPGERAAVVGCGTSWFIAQAFAALREEAGQGETDAFPASEFPAGRRYDRVLAITRSGTTTEVLDLLARQRERTTTVAVTADPRTPVADRAHHLVPLEHADEQSVVQTRFATAVLALLRAHLGEDTGPATGDAERAVTEDLPGRLLSADQFTFLGTGWTYGLAQEAALKMREAAGAWTEAYPAMEYRHGPVSITGPGRVVWVFGAVPEGLDADVARAGGTLVAGSRPGEGPALDPMADLIRAQRLAVAVAEAKGLDPDRPRHLTRSVVLG
ncbi:SIS domain-containing protein [Streptomyces meridianus]|uniref:SIS domain-containing protein n=1 Tax=Streptomyces meridianus TaxID=2938945 RepID=A0ABT0XC43_9ACTN|nr:SIS domain-containing protein [Streptomyces meridianus]MCM2580081.1 SIS domain-containing protein [Streptomyces meridianus]